MKHDKPQRPKLPQFLYSCTSALLFTLSHKACKCFRLSVSHKACASTLFSFSPPLLFSLCASNLFFYLLFLVLSVLNSLNQSSSFSTYMLHTPHSTALLSHFSISHHPQATQPRSRILLTHLKGAQPQIINEGEGKLNPFHHSLKSLNFFSF